MGTPIGNLGDLSPRAAETFRTADLICCEDTRVTSKLLAHLGISKSLMRCDDNVIGPTCPPSSLERVLAGERIRVRLGRGHAERVRSRSGAC